ncbi:MAG TPA: PhoPQ-activated pathogenicity-related family protein [Candidatus Acidoferrum sp.]|jgi:PhoPQ-activated pathogenicity-related protein|nr:PhoPQ-activated pathogenicity-related family protein [Candidatus Acidoferrum sp.]
MNNPSLHKFIISRQHWLWVFVLSGLTLAGCSRGLTEAARDGQSKSAGRQGEQAQRTALDEYVARPDTNYSYQLVSTLPGQGHTTFILEMTSQAWLTTNEVDRPLWKHWLLLVKPDDVTTTKSFLFISGGANDGKVPKSADGNLVRIALATKSVVTELKMIPNQPLVFAGETEGRKEDSLIAYTWDKFLRTGDSKWPARLPMTKAAVRAMDTVTAFCGSTDGGNLKVDGFVVAGGSKRGWTTWTTAAVDARVIAIIPCVIDLLNIEPSMLHHYAAYGFWAPSIEDYTALRIMDWNGTPEYRALMRIEEPFEYRQRFTMPKFMVNAAGDQFFLPDSSQFYFKDLPGVKYLRYVPNTDHSLKGSDAYETLLACYHAVLNHVPLPEFSWTVEKDGSLRVTAKDRPTAAKLWQATNPDARDFRLETLGPRYQSAPLADAGGGLYIGKVTKPEKGWTAFFVELTFPSGCQAPFKFTTQVCVVPDLLPYKFAPRGRPQ